MCPDLLDVLVQQKIDFFQTFWVIHVFARCTSPAKELLCGHILVSGSKFESVIICTTFIQPSYTSVRFSAHFSKRPLHL